MSFTGQLGTAQSQLGQIELGVAGGGSASLTVDAVLLRTQSSSLTLDAAIAVTRSANLTLDAFVQFYLRLDAVIVKPTHFTAQLGIADSQLGNIVPGLAPSGGGGSVSGTTTETLTTADVATRLFSGSRTTSETPQTADVATRHFVGFRSTAESPTTSDASSAIVSIVRTATEHPITSDVATFLRTHPTSLTLDAQLKAIRSRGLTLDAYLDVAFVKHDRTASHFGVDHSLDHVLSQAFDRYQWRDNLHEVLSDMDARITDLEGSRRLRVSRLSRLNLDAVIKGSRAFSLTLDAVIV